MNQLTKVTLHKIDPRQSVADQEQATLYHYDKRGLVTMEINAAADETIYVYDGDGNLIQKTDADGYVTEYAYDPRNLVEQISYTGGKEVQFTYNANGELIAMMDWNGTVNFALDQLGRITSVNDHNEQITGYTYDETGNKTSRCQGDSVSRGRGYDNTTPTVNL